MHEPPAATADMAAPFPEPKVSDVEMPTMESGERKARFYRGSKQRFDRSGA
jgi:hypothetical protein